jgi:carbonic anhydrase
VGVLLMAGEEDNAAYASIFENLPAEKSDPQATDIAVALMSLLPEEQTFYTYQGSLTTPPCSEIVRWLLLDTPVYLSEAQIESFAAIFEMNARHAQEINGRDLLHDSN